MTAKERPMKACLALLLVAACGGSAEDAKKFGPDPIIVDNKLYASAINSTYSVTPPVSGSQCPASQPGLANPCYYVALGNFTDTYTFSVPMEAVYSAEVTGNHWHYCVSSGRAHPCYTESMTISSAFVVDSASNVLLQLAGNGDDWTGAVDLPAGDYSLLISGEVAGNRAGIYGYSIAAGP